MKVYDLSKDTIERHQFGDPLLRHLTDKILQLIDLPGGRALDVGCGAGRLAVALARRGFEVDGVDVAASVVEQAAQLASEAGISARFFVADFRQPDARFPDETYDLVVCSEVVEHVESWRSVLDNIARVLKPGGLLLLTTPNDPAQFSILDEYAGHFRRFRWRELETGLSEFSVLTAFTVGFPLTPALHPAERFISLVGEKLSVPDRLSDYFDSTRSSLDPYSRGYGSFVYGTLPVVLAKAAGRLVGKFGYDGAYLVGRVLSGLFDLVSAWVVYLLARRAGPRLGRSAAFGAAGLLVFCPFAIQL